MKRTFYIFLVLIAFTKLHGQEIELSNSWFAKKASEVNLDGKQLTSSEYAAQDWLIATVPGTVLTTLINNGLAPDPDFGLNNNLITDISIGGSEEYTYWFYTRFRMAEMTGDKQVWLKFRGLNYFADIYLNGEKVNSSTHEGMFLREKYLITDLLEGGSVNRLAVYVQPPDPVGFQNGSNGGDGTAGKLVGTQLNAGWDWHESAADRNTGIWDVVSVEITGPVDIRDPYVETKVPGIRTPGELQEPAYITFSAELVNASDEVQKGEVHLVFLQTEKIQKVTLAPNSTTVISFKEVKQTSPRLWWPNGMGTPALYTAQLLFSQDDETVSDSEQLSFGIRETSSYFDDELGSRIFQINGQKIFIKGGNWVASDALLRLSRDRYDSEVKMYSEMNMNTIRVWGGSITERPDFYDVCDKYGILVWQDLWMTGDVNGKIPDVKKTDSQEIRRTYPDDHELFIKSVTDQIKMLRNHPSLFLWCGGDGFSPPDDINKMLKDSIFPLYDPTRYYLSESTSQDLFKNDSEATFDETHSLQEPYSFFIKKLLPFNPGIGSVGLPNITSLKKIMDVEDLAPPTIEDDGSSEAKRLNEVWNYHKYMSYGNFLERYGKIKNLDDFVMKAQLVNYEQYRSIQEGYNARMWEWYSGVLIWKSQNAGTALQGQLYDIFLDQNAGFYGYKHAAQPLHVQLNMDDTTVCIINSLPKERKDISVKVAVYGIHGNQLSKSDIRINVMPYSVIDTMKLLLPKTDDPVYFVRLSMSNINTGVILDENFYWLSPSNGDYTGLNVLAEATVSVIVNKVSATKAVAEIRNTGSETSFFMKGMVTDQLTGTQILPIFMDENYFTLFPGEKKLIEIDLYNITAESSGRSANFELDGWNLEKQKVLIP